MQTKIINVVLMMSVLIPSVWGMDMQMMHDDERESLGMKGTMRGEHQLLNMREHLSGISEIIHLMNTNQYDQASAVATEKLGMRLDTSMCGSFNNRSFEEIGTAFHQAGDDLAETLKTKDYTKSMAVMEKVLNKCVQCHAKFKQ